MAFIKSVFSLKKDVIAYILLKCT